MHSSVTVSDISPDMLVKHGESWAGREERIEHWSNPHRILGGYGIEVYFRSPEMKPAILVRKWLGANAGPSVRSDLRGVASSVFTVPWEQSPTHRSGVF